MSASGARLEIHGGGKPLTSTHPPHAGVLPLRVKEWGGESSTASGALPVAGWGEEILARFLASWGEVTPTQVSRKELARHDWRFAAAPPRCESQPPCFTETESSRCEELIA